MKTPLAILAAAGLASAAWAGGPPAGTGTTPHPQPELAGFAVKKRTGEIYCWMERPPP